METLLLSLLLVAGGLYFGFRNLRLLRNETALREYVRNSPKAALWVRKYGVDGATNLTRRSFLPVGLVISAAMVGLGGWSLWRMYV